MRILIHYSWLILRALAVPLALAALRGLVWLVNLLVIAPLFDPLRDIAGPEGRFFESHFYQTTDPGVGPEVFAQWRRDYGETMRFNGFGKFDYRLLTFDLRALAHIFTSPTYEKPWSTRTFLSKLIGNGIFSTEGNQHRIQRKLIAPAFSHQVVKALSPMFLDKAEQLAHIWDCMITADSKSNDAELTIDVTKGLSRMTFDIIGLGGFDYCFNSLENEAEPVHMAFRQMFGTLDDDMSTRKLLEIYYPMLEKIWPTEDNKIVARSHKTIGEAVQQIISRKKEQIESNGQDSNPKDILGLLIKANMTSEESTQLTDQELADQCRTFLHAGADSSAVSMSWCLHFLANHPEIQTQLHDEIQRIFKEAKSSECYDSDGSDDSGFAEDPDLKPESTTNRPHSSLVNMIESVTYLTNVVKEALRLCPPVHSTIRVATTDDDIPLAEPIEVGGTKVSSIHIRKGTYIHIPIEGVNMSEELWGADALEFNPSRWDHLPKHVANPNYPGIGHLITFGYGHSSCIGSKFTLSELKIAIATLVARFEFLPAESTTISKYNCVITRPYVFDRWEDRTSLPLRVRRRRGH